MLDLSQITNLFDAVILPLVGCIALLFAKFTEGEAARWAEKQFFAVLLVITLVTLRTVITCNEVWLVQTTTLGTLIICSMMIPSQDTPVAV